MNKAISLAEHILEVLSELGNTAFLSRRELWAKFYGNYKRQTFYNTLSNLQKKGFIAVGEDKTRLTDRGRKHWKKVAARHPVFEKPPLFQSKNKLIVMYDIPEPQKGEREWFRFQLREFGYKMIQKSVWIGPDPLPKDFWEYIKTIKLDKCLHLYRVRG